MYDSDRVKAVGFLKQGERSTLLPNAPRSCRGTGNENREEQDEKQGKGRKNGDVLFAKDAREMVCFVAMKQGDFATFELGSMCENMKRTLSYFWCEGYFADNR